MNKHELRAWFQTVIFCILFEAHAPTAPLLVIGGMAVINFLCFVVGDLKARKAAV